MTKRIVSILLAVVLTLAMATVAVVSVSAAVDANGAYVPSDTVENTVRVYFLMPKTWYSEKTYEDSPDGGKTAGVYWWGGPDSCGSVDGASVGAKWPGYKTQIDEAYDDLYYIDLPYAPTELSPIVFNNFLDGGTRNVDADTGAVTFQFDQERFLKAQQTTDITASYYSEGDDAFYDQLLDDDGDEIGEFWTMADEAFNGEDKTFFGNFESNFFEDPDWGISMNFDNMIYVVDPSKTSENFEGKLTYVGEWYFYYGDGTYGSLPNKEMASEMGFVNKLDAPAPTIPGTTPTTPPPATNPTSASKPAASPDETIKGDNNAIQTGAVSTAIIVFAIFAIAGGAVVVTRKRYE